jgi:hypothetical protein
MLSVSGLGAQVHDAREPHRQGHGIPESLRHEHAEVQRALQELTNVPGEVGAAARDLRRILMPHFEREEQIALPPLGVVRRLANEPRAADLASWLLPMTDSLRAELPRMLEEHVAIARAGAELERVARSAGNTHAQHFAQALARHAQSEEELFYPMAILVGEVVRKRAAP